MFLTQPVFAHSGDASGLASGFLHPILGLDHLVAMVAVGIIGAVVGGKAIWLLPTYFPVVMAIGGVLGIKGVPLPYAEVLIALSVVVFGMVIAVYRPISMLAAGMLVSFFALFHGHAHGVELPEATAPVEYCIGFVLATGLLHAAGISISLLDRKKFGKNVLRAIGAFISASGLYFLLA